MPRGGARPGAGKKPTGRKTVPVTLQLHPDLKAKWDAATAGAGLSRPDWLAKKLKWKKPVVQG